MKRLIRRLRKVNRLVSQAIEDGHTDKIMQGYYLQRQLTAQIILLIELSNFKRYSYDILI